MNSVFFAASSILALFAGSKCCNTKVLKVLFIFIDGVGLRPPASDNPVNAAVTSELCRLIAGEGKAIDACMGVKGLPQSATGQTAIYTGVNASEYMGRHCEGFPGPSLRKVIEKNNIFMELTRMGLRCRFADAYPCDSVEDIYDRRFKSVTTVMALTEPHTISLLDDLLEDQAVFHDITRFTLQEQGSEVPLVTPAQAAEHLVQLALGYNFTLFEFFLSDLAGHSTSYEQACGVLRPLDHFLEALVKLTSTTDLLLVITSDHGNIEDMGTRGHTRNPVPLIALGPQAGTFKAGVESLTDITPQLLRMFRKEEAGEEDR